MFTNTFKVASKIVRWESNWIELSHSWGFVSLLKLKCVTGFGDKVSPVSEILKSQGWPVPPQPPHCGRPCAWPHNTGREGIMYLVNVHYLDRDKTLVMIWNYHAAWALDNPGVAGWRSCSFHQNYVGEVTVASWQLRSETSPSIRWLVITPQLRTDRSPPHPHHVSIISPSSLVRAQRGPGKLRSWTSLYYLHSAPWLQSQPCTHCTCHGPAEPVVVHFTWTSSSLHQTSQQLVPGQTLVCQYSSLWRQHDKSPSHNLFKMP